MKRDLEALQRKEYDLVVIGGGIYGAFVAWDASLRGLSVALIEQKDFGHATSANSLKTIHGGLRYLKDLNPGRARMMIHEQQTWLRIAPDFVRPMPVILPTQGSFLSSRWLMKAAFLLNRAVGLGIQGSPEKLPGSRILSREEAAQKMKDHFPDWANGAALWYDCQVSNTERLLFSIVRAASKLGADVANYLDVTEILFENSRACGVRVEDRLDGGDSFNVRSRIVANCAGPWFDRLIPRSGYRDSSTGPGWSTAVNILVPRIFANCAVALPRVEAGSEGDELTHRTPLLFIVPWESSSIVGTLHRAIPGVPGTENPCEEEAAEELLRCTNRALPGANLKLSDVSLVHRGYLPCRPCRTAGERVRLIREGRIYDHQETDGLQGLISVMGVKYTSARLLAEQVVDLASFKLGLRRLPCTTSVTPLWEGDCSTFDSSLRLAVAKRPQGMSVKTARRLALHHPSSLPRILNLVAERPGAGLPVPGQEEVTEAEVLFALQEEMAFKLEDIVRRRTALGSERMPPETVLWSCARLMEAELGRDQIQPDRQVREVQAGYFRAGFRASERSGSLVGVGT